MEMVNCSPDDGFLLSFDDPDDVVEPLYAHDGDMT